MTDLGGERKILGKKSWYIKPCLFRLFISEYLFDWNNCVAGRVITKIRNSPTLQLWKWILRINVFTREELKLSGFISFLPIESFREESSRNMQIFVYSWVIFSSCQEKISSCSVVFFFFFTDICKPNSY